MRWEYVDRSQSAFHHLWVMNPDGTQQQALFGNMHPRNLYIDAKPIPGTKEIVFSSQDGHGGGEHRGAVATYKIDQGPDVQTDMKIWSLSDYEDPFPVIDENWFIAARDKNIVLMSRDGALEILYSTAGISAREPRPIMPSKRPPVIADRTDWTQKTGRLMLSDVHIGRKMANVKKGEIKQLLVMETVPKPVNWGGGVLDMTSVSYAGSFTLERVLGTVPVEPDGSANFEVPANQPLILAAIDENGSLVKRMHSFVSVMPGETLSCIGCHEDRTMVTPPMTKLPAAYTRAPDTIKPLDGIPEIFDYNRDIQPIWDKHCVSCHNNEKPSGMVNLTRDRGITYTQSYMNLRARKEFFLGNNQHGNYEPRTVGDSASPLMKRLSGEHHGVKLSPLEFQKVQTWINAGGGTYTSTYSALGTGHLFPNMLHHDILKFKFDFPEIKAGHASLAKNCATCHTKEKEVNKIEEFEGNHMLWPRFGRKQRPFAPAEYIQHALYNFTDIEESRVLKIGLAKDAGGFATNPAGTRKVERDENGVWKHPVVFKDKNEQGYKDLQAYIQAFKNFLDKNPQYDSPDFIPNEAYVREMKRFGIMPADYDPTTRTLDFGKLEKIYFDETWKDAWPEEIRASVFEK